MTDADVVDVSVCVWGLGVGEVGGRGGGGGLLSFHKILKPKHKSFSFILFQV